MLFRHVWTTRNETEYCHRLFTQWNAFPKIPVGTGESGTANDGKEVGISFEKLAQEIGADASLVREYFTLDLRLSYALNP